MSKCGNACCIHHLSLDYTTSKSQISVAYNNKGLFLAPVTCSLWFGWMSLFWKGDVGSAPIWAWRGWRGGRERQNPNSQWLSELPRRSLSLTIPPHWLNEWDGCHQGGAWDRPTGRGSKPWGTRTEPAAPKGSGHCLAREKMSVNREHHSYQSVKWGN